MMSKTRVERNGAQVTPEIKAVADSALALHHAPALFLQIATEFATIGSMFSLSQPIRLTVQDKLAALRRLAKRNPMQKPFYIFGAGCQARCILNAALEAGYRPLCLPRRSSAGF